MSVGLCPFCYSGCGMLFDLDAGGMLGWTEILLSACKS